VDLLTHRELAVYIDKRQQTKCKVISGGTESSHEAYGRPIERDGGRRSSIEKGQATLDQPISLARPVRP